jgi:hypothetical protein
MNELTVIDKGEVVAQNTFSTELLAAGLPLLTLSQRP